jgi:hypothetical protein
MIANGNPGYFSTDRSRTPINVYLAIGTVAAAETFEKKTFVKAKLVLSVVANRRFYKLLAWQGRRGWQPCLRLTYTPVPLVGTSYFSSPPSVRKAACDTH